MNGKENEFVYEGKRYIAVDAKDCDGCAFYNPQGRCNIAHAPCVPTLRSDRRNVIFTEHPPAPTDPVTECDAFLAECRAAVEAVQSLAKHIDGLAARLRERREVRT